MLDFWIITLGCLTAASCALLGNFLVLRRMSMMGDAISHAVLPGLADAFLITASRDSLPMFIGAVIVGVLTALLTQFLTRFGRVDEGGSMGIVFTTLFAIGLILIVRAADKVDLDADCVLYGAVEVVASEYAYTPSGIPPAAWRLGAVLLINAIFVIAFFKELRITSFDPELADTLGYRPNLMHYLLMTLVAITAVASFEVIGNILVVAMLIVPAAAAHLLTERLWPMIVVSLLIALASAILGHLAAITVPPWFGYPDTISAGAMAAVAGLIFMAVLLLAPRHGVASRLLHRALLSIRIEREDMLAGMYRSEEAAAAAGGGAIEQPVARGLFGRLALSRLRRGALIEGPPGDVQLTDKGRARAAELLRSHRLWESYLASEVGVRADHTHRSAEQLEHITDREMRDRLQALGPDPTSDPQGKPIPPEQNGGAGA